MCFGNCVLVFEAFLHKLSFIIFLFLYENEISESKEVNSIFVAVDGYLELFMVLSVFSFLYFKDFVCDCDMLWAETI
jgi:hypothetical protein